MNVHPPLRTFTSATLFAVLCFAQPFALAQNGGDGKGTLTVEGEVTDSTCVVYFKDPTGTQASSSSTLKLTAVKLADLKTLQNAGAEYGTPDKFTIVSLGTSAASSGCLLDGKQFWDFEINSLGSIKCGKRVRGVNLIFTDVDVHAASYIGLPYVYSFEKAGSGCGVISSQAVAAIDTAAIWMSKSGFWIYDGYVRPLPSDVGDYIFQNINYNQSSKVYAVHNSKYGEIIWFYPSSASNENDSYVTYNYRERHWAIGTLSRTAGTDRGVFTYPLMISSDGYIYEHEVGYAYDGASPFVESGPYQIGNGDNIMSVRQVIPDEQTLGEVVISFKTRMYPTSTETTFGPYPAAQPTDVRFAARQVKVRYTGAVLEDWRVGVNRFDVVAMGKR